MWTIDRAEPASISRGRSIRFWLIVGLVVLAVLAAGWDECKTGSGDNRLETFARDGRMTSSKAVNRTAAFAFYIGDRFYGVVTTVVPGSQASHYRFTSALPVAVLLAPAIEDRLQTYRDNRTVAAPEQSRSQPRSG